MPDREAQEAADQARRRKRRTAARPPVRAGRVRAIDVARHAGVSSATVSLVLNGIADGRVSTEVQERVRNAIGELGYVVDLSARSLVTGRRHCVALVARDITNPTISQIASGVSSVLGSENQLLLAISGDRASDPGLDQVVAFGVDGFLLHCPSPSQLEAIPKGTPTVLLDHPARGSTSARIAYDSRKGAVELAAHLVQHGHRRIVYLDAVRAARTFALRRQFFIDEIRRLDPTVMIERLSGEVSLESAHQLAVENWETWRDSEITAVTTAADVQAYGLISGLDSLGVSIPGHLSIASFDNSAFSAIVRPPLTSVDLPAAEMGRLGAQMLLKLVSGGESNPANRTVELPTALIVRESTGPAQRIDA